MHPIHAYHAFLGIILFVNAFSVSDWPVGEKTGMDPGDAINAHQKEAAARGSRVSGFR